MLTATDVYSVSLFPFSDDLELDAQVSAPIPHCQSQWYHAITLFDLQDLRIQGEPIYWGDCLSKWKGRMLARSKLAEDEDRMESIWDSSFRSLQITQLKIDHNPFAKGFRESGAGKSQKKWVQTVILLRASWKRIDLICLNLKCWLLTCEETISWTWPPKTVLLPSRLND